MLSNSIAVIMKKVITIEITNTYRVVSICL